MEKHKISAIVRAAVPDQAEIVGTDVLEAVVGCAMNERELSTLPLHSTTGSHFDIQSSLEILYYTTQIVLASILIRQASQGSRSDHSKLVEQLLSDADIKSKLRNAGLSAEEVAGVLIAHDE